CRGRAGPAAGARPCEGRGRGGAGGGGIAARLYARRCAGQAAADLRKDRECRAMKRGRVTSPWRGGRKPPSRRRERLSGGGRCFVECCKRPLPESGGGRFRPSLEGRVTLGGTARCFSLRSGG